MTLEQLLKAMNRLFPSGGYNLHEDEETKVAVVSHLDDGLTMPTEEELAVALVEAENEEAAMLYRNLRAKEYPPIGDQLDALWKGGDELLEMQARIQSIKNKYPKT